MSCGGGVYGKIWDSTLFGAREDASVLAHILHEQKLVFFCVLPPFYVAHPNLSL
jgi:hypothetical protein